MIFEKNSCSKLLALELGFGSCLTLIIHHPGTQGLSFILPVRMSLNAALSADKLVDTSAPAKYRECYLRGRVHKSHASCI